MNSSFEQKSGIGEPWWSVARLGVGELLSEKKPRQWREELSFFERRLSPEAELEFHRLLAHSCFERSVVFERLKRIALDDPPAGLVLLRACLQVLGMDSGGSILLPQDRLFFAQSVAPFLEKVSRQGVWQEPADERPDAFDWAVTRGSVLSKDWGPSAESGDAVFAGREGDWQSVGALCEALAPVYSHQINQFESRLCGILKATDPDFFEGGEESIPELIGLFDGVGGASGDRIASHVAAFAFGRWTQPWRGHPLSEVRWRYKEIFFRVHRLLTDLGRELQAGALDPASNFHRLGTTAILAQLFSGSGETKALVMGVGDSLSYQYEQQTGLAQGILPTKARQYVGCGMSQLPSSFQTRILPLAPGDKVVLMSDGYEQLTSADIAAQQALMQWDGLTTITSRLSSLAFFAEFSQMIRGHVKRDDRSVAELASPLSPFLQKTLLAEKKRRVADAGFLLPTPAQRARWTLPLETRTVAWRALRSLYPLKKHPSASIASLAGGADASRRDLQEAIWRLGYACESGRVRDQSVEQILGEIEMSRI